MKSKVKTGICTAALLCLGVSAMADKIDDLINEGISDKGKQETNKSKTNSAPPAKNTESKTTAVKSSPADTANIDSEALKLDPGLELFARTANQDQLNLKQMQIFASNEKLDKALVYADKILESKTAPKTDKLAVLNGANWTVKRTRKAMVSGLRDTVKDEKYWSGLIGMTDCGSRLTRYYRVYTLRSIDEKEFKQLESDNIKYRKMLLELDPANDKSKYELAFEYISQNRPDEALPILEELYKKPVPAPDAKLDLRNFYTDVCLWYGNVLFMKGNLQGALKVMEKYLADATFDRQPRGGWSKGKREAEFYLYTLRDHGRFNDMKYPHYTESKAYPEPKEAQYSEKFASLSSVKLELGKDLSKDSAQVRYLTTKLEAYGVKISDSAPFTIRFNTGAAKAPEKPEAYTVKVTENAADLQGFDRAGTTWAASSFVQLIDHSANPKIRICDIRDWPDMKFRGNWGKSWDIRFPEFFITGKLNLTALGGYLDESNWSMDLMQPMKRAAQKEYIRLMRELGITVYVTMPTSWYMPKTSERTLKYYTEICNEIADLGGNVWWLHDDSSNFGQPDWDMKESNGDIYKTVMAEFTYLNNLYAAVKKNHPDFRLLFSPIYYFFAEGQNYQGIPKDKYMTDLGRNLDKNIEVMWCGPRVRTTVVEKDQTEYWTSLAQRKPSFWQNPYSPHGDLHIVLGDLCPGWSEFHYKGFFDDLTMYFDAGDIGPRTAMLMEYANFAWNLAKQENCKDPVSENTQKLAYDICYGKGALETIRPGAAAIWALDAYPTYFSTYLANDARTNIPRALMEYEHVMEAIDTAEKVWEKMKKLYPEGIAEAPTDYLNFAGRERIGNAMDKQLQKLGRSALMDAAAKAGYFDVKSGDQFKSPLEFFGGAESMPMLFAQNEFSFDKNGPYRKKVFGAGAKTVSKDNNLARAGREPDLIIKMDQLQTKFFRAKDAKGDCELILCGKNEKLLPGTQGCKIEVLVNDQKVFEGNTAFPAGEDFGIQKINIPANVMKESNNLLIRNLDKYDPKASSGNPDGKISYFSIKYGVFHNK